VRIWSRWRVDCEVATEPAVIARASWSAALVAQALVEGAIVVTHDRALAPYDVPTIWT
jgi:hypothetical protein